MHLKRLQHQHRILKLKSSTNFCTRKYNQCLTSLNNINLYIKLTNERFTTLLLIKNITSDMSTSFTMPPLVDSFAIRRDQESFWRQSGKESTMCLKLILLDFLLLLNIPASNTRPNT